MLLTVSAAVLAAAGITLAAPPAVHAEGPPSVVTLGDSYISGEAGRWQGNGDIHVDSFLGSAYGTDRAAYDCNASESWCWHDPRRVYGASAENGCDRSLTSEVTYVRQVHLRGIRYPIAPADRLNVACSGATSSAIIARFKGEAPQADQLINIARRTSVKAVILSIGGNDIGFASIVETCIAAFTIPGATHCNAIYGPEVPALVATMQHAALRSINTIRSAMADAGYAPSDYRLILQSYPSVIPPGAGNRYSQLNNDRTLIGGCPFFNDDSDFADRRLVPALDNGLATVARQTGAEYFGLLDALTGHRLCEKGVEQASSHNRLTNPLPRANSEWVRWIGVVQGTTQEDLHPNHYGQQSFGSCLNTLLDTVRNSIDCAAH